MQRVNSAALGEVASVLGVSGTGVKAGLGAPVTELDEDRLDQVIAVNDLIRRGLSPAGTTGWFVLAFDLTMGAGVTDETASITPYAPTAALINAPFPHPVPQNRDIWLIGASGVINGATASNFVEAGIRLECPIVHQGVGVNEAGTAITAAVSNFELGVFDSQDLVASRVILLTEAGRGYIPLGIRLRRGQILHVDASATNAVGIRVTLIAALLTAGLGQDIGP